MRVGLDVSPLDLTRAGTARVVTELERRAGVDYVRLAFHAGGRAGAALRDAVWYPHGLARSAARAQVELLHCPTFRGPLRPPRMPLVVTVHDLAVLRHPETFNLWTRRYSRHCVPRVVQAATLVIAVSEFTKRELVELLRVPPEKVRVVANGVTESFMPAGPAAEGNYVLAVGTLEPRKNLERLVEATGRLGVELRIAGARGWGRVELNGSNVQWLGELGDDRLAELYRGARCLVYPSLYEGFGIPVLEAMACGTPVVTSRGGALEETAGGAAVLVDPHDVASIAEGIERAELRRDELAALGLARAATFGWDRTAYATVAVYREALARGQSL
jgi:glycosyltransferase involved in cell wall biosynthesis